MFANVFWNTMSQLTACLEGTGRESLPTEGRGAWPGAGHGFTTSLPSDSCLLIPTDSCLLIAVDSSSRLNGCVPPERLSASHLATLLARPSRAPLLRAGHHSPHQTSFLTTLAWCLGESKLCSSRRWITESDD